MIDHERFLLLAAGAVDRMLTEEEARGLEAHLASCPSCRFKATALRHDQLQLARTLAPVPVAPRVRAVVLRAAQGRRRASPWPLLAAAALLIPAIVGSALFLGSRPQAPAVVQASPSNPNLPSSSVPSGAGALVTGTYTYVTGDGGRRAVTVDASGASGTWWFRTLPSGPIRTGPVTCLVAVGSDAWLAGPTSTGDAAAFVYVHDGGTAPSDTAVAWITDPGQTLRDMESWCEVRATHVERYPLTSGSLFVRTRP